MSEVLKDVPVADMPVPPGVVHTQGEWYYDEFTPGQGVAKLSGGDSAPGAPDGGRPVTPVDAQDKRSILDLFKN